MTTDTGLHRIGWTGLARLIGGGVSLQSEKAPRRILKPVFVSLSAALILIGPWVLLSGYSSKPAESEKVNLAAAVTPEPAPSTATDIPQDTAMPNPAAMPGELTAAAAMAPVNGLKIASQSWRRGGLGSKALVTLTLRNGNDYSVKDIEISCAFTRRDGTHLTDRSRMINDTVRTRGRRTFARLHVGFVNVNAERAKCSLVTASRL